jgi:hypothetical protein
MLHLTRDASPCLRPRWAIQNERFHLQSELVWIKIHYAIVPSGAGAMDQFCGAITMPKIRCPSARSVTDDGGPRDSQDNGDVEYQL